jgi:hypothetical protein
MASIALTWLVNLICAPVETPGGEITRRMKRIRRGLIRTAERRVRTPGMKGTLLHQAADTPNPNLTLQNR